MSKKKIKPAQDLHARYIRGTDKDAIVQNIEVFFCRLTHAVQKAIGVDSVKEAGKMRTMRVYLKTRVLKHSYDKRPAEEYDFFIENLHAIVKYPELIYQNQYSKRGDYAFVKTIGNNKYLCSLECKNIGTPDCRMEIVTFFRPKETYLKNYTLLWSWRDDKSPHRNTFDSGRSQPTSIPQ